MSQVSRSHQRAHRIPKKGNLYLPVLVLNASFEAVQITTVRRALVMVINSIAMVEQTYDTIAHSRYEDFRMPSVIRLLQYRKVPRQSRTLSRKNILIRDHYRCLYCGQSFAGGDLTLDHVVPLVQGGESSWLNLASACFPCNSRKGGRTPEEAGMPLLRRPAPMSLHAKHRYYADHINPDWDRYLFY